MKSYTNHYEVAEEGYVKLTILNTETGAELAVLLDNIEELIEELKKTDWYFSLNNGTNYQVIPYLKANEYTNFRKIIYSYVIEDYTDNEIVSLKSFSKKANNPILDLRKENLRLGSFKEERIPVKELKVTEEKNTYSILFNDVNVIINKDKNLLKYLQQYSFSVGKYNKEIHTKKSTKDSYTATLISLVYEFYKGYSLVNMHNVFEINITDDIKLKKDYRIENLDVRATRKRYRDILVDNVYTELENGKVKLSIENLTNENVIDIILDKDIAEKLKKKKWNVFSYKYPYPKIVQENLEAYKNKLINWEISICSYGNSFNSYNKHKHKVNMLQEIKEILGYDKIYMRNLAENNVFDYSRDNLTENFKESSKFKNIDLTNFLKKGKEYSENRFNTDYQIYTSNLAVTVNRERSELNEELVEEFRDMYATGRYSFKELSEIVGVNVNTLKSIVQYRTWNQYLVAGYTKDRKHLKKINLNVSPIHTQEDVTYNLLNDLEDVIFNFNDGVTILMHKPVDFQIYFEFYINSEYKGSFQVYLFNQTEVNASKKKIKNLRILSKRIKQNALPQSHFYRYINAISDYYTSNI